MVFWMCASQTMDLSFLQKKNSKHLVINGNLSTTSLPRYPQSNRKAEQAIKAAKNLMNKAKKAGADPYLSLLSQKTHLLKGSTQVMSRRTKTLLLTTTNHLNPKLSRNVDKKLCVQAKTDSSLQT